MSTSPSWFDQDKFARLVKKVGPKTAPAQPGATQALSTKVAGQSLIKELDVSPSVVTPPSPAPEPTLSKPELKVEAPKEEPKDEIQDSPPAPAKSKPFLTSTHAEAGTLPPEEETPKKLALEEEPEDLTQPPAESKPVAPKFHFEAGSIPLEDPEEAEEPTAANESEEADDDADAPALPTPASRPPIFSNKMMTSQSLSLGKKTAPPPLPTAAPKSEPIRAPEPVSKGALNLESEQPASGLPRRTAALPALKSLFQYEIPGGQGTVPGKPPVEAPAAKPPLPSLFSSKTESKAAPEIAPPDLDDEEDIPSFAGISDAGHLAESAEGELSTENLAAVWGKQDELQEQLEQVIKERDDALAENDALLLQVHELEKKATVAPAAPVGDDAKDSEELEIAIRERDEVRGEYIKLREDFEKLKQEQLEPQEPSAPAPADPELEKEIEALREQLADKDSEIGKMKTSSTGLNDVVETLKEELDGLKEELQGLKDEAKKSKDEASIAQRGLALSQKALQETREALREASETLKK